MNEIRKKKKTKKITIPGHYPRSNMAIIGNMRQVDNPIIGTISEPIIMEVPIKEKKKDKKKK